MKFYRCKHCGNIIMKIKDSKVPVSCCGEKMEELTLNSVDFSNEKHMPVLTITDNVMNVNIGSVNHPMTPEHFIEWIYVEYENGGELVYLKDVPFVNINIENKNVKAVYSYCNLHGLWYKEI